MWLSIHQRRGQRKTPKLNFNLPRFIYLWVIYAPNSPHNRCFCLNHLKVDKKWHQTYLTDIGNNEIIYKTNLENLKDCINIDPKEPLMLSSTKLPSGAEIHVLIKLPMTSTIKCIT